MRTLLDRTPRREDCSVRNWLEDRVECRSDNFCREARARLAGGWQLFCHKSRLSSPGEYVLDEFGGVSVFLVSGQDGIARCFFNACLHLGAGLVRKEHGKKKFFTCPYHGWAYAPTGALVNIAAPEAYRGTGVPVDSQHLKLRELPLLEEAGFLFSKSGEAEFPQSTSNELAERFSQEYGAFAVSGHANAAIWLEFHESVATARRALAAFEPTFIPPNAFILGDDELAVSARVDPVDSEVSICRLYQYTAKGYAGRGLLPEALLALNDDKSGQG